MKEQIIHLQPHDDITTVREKLRLTRAPRVLMVFPTDPRHPILQRKLDLVLMQREATRLQKQVALITRDRIVIERANEVGLANFRNIKKSQKTYWRSLKASPLIERSDDLPELSVDLIEGGTRLQGERFALPPHIQRLATGGLFALLGALVLAVLIFILPGATISLKPAGNQVTVTTTISAHPELDIAALDTQAGVMPARIIGVEVEATESIETTGALEVPTDKARGIALFTNLIPDQVTIPAGTIVRTSASEPVRFVTLTDATLAGEIGETIEVPIEALDAGYTGNLPPNRINQIEGTLSTRLAVTNSISTQGGDVQEVSAIVQEDYDRVRALVLQQIQRKAFAEMQTSPFINLQDTEFVPAESLSVVLFHSETYDGYVDQPGETVTLTMRVTVQGIAIDELYARQIVYAHLAEKVGTGYQIGSETLVFRRGEITGIDENRAISFIMQGAGDVTVALDTDLIRRRIQGKTIEDALVALNHDIPLSAPPRIEVWPGFWPLMPLMPGRIEIEVSN